MTDVRVVREFRSRAGELTDRNVWTGPLTRVGHRCIVLGTGYVHIGTHTQPDGSTMTTTYTESSPT